MNCLEYLVYITLTLSQNLNFIMKFPLDNDTPCTRPGTNPIMCQCCGQIQQQTTAPAGPPALVQPHGQPSPQWFTTHQPPQYGQPGLPHQPGPQLHPFIMQPAAHTPLGPRLCPRAAQLGMRCHLFYAFCSFAVFIYISIILIRCGRVVRDFLPYPKLRKNLLS